MYNLFGSMTWDIYLVLKVITERKHGGMANRKNNRII